MKRFVESISKILWERTEEEQRQIWQRQRLIEEDCESYSRCPGDCTECYDAAPLAAKDRAKALKKAWMMFWLEAWKASETTGIGFGNYAPWIMAQI